jgi:molybdopterin molybdotransferase
MTGFDTVVVADWSARATPSPARPSKDAIFLGICRDGYVATLYQRTRSQAMRNIRGLIDGDLRAGRRILLAFDFPFAYPRGLAEPCTGDGDPLEMWAYLARGSRMTTATATTGSRSPRRLNGMFGRGRPVLGPSGRGEGPGPALSQTRP